MKNRLDHNRFRPKTTIRLWQFFFLFCLFSSCVCVCFFTNDSLSVHSPVENREERRRYLPTFHVTTVDICQPRSKMLSPSEENKRCLDDLFSPSFEHVRRNRSPRARVLIGSAFFLTVRIKEGVVSILGFTEFSWIFKRSVFPTESQG